jgi:peptidoglycan/xylan/chitin deacetylase (PgdA/CDA1 family)
VPEYVDPVRRPPLPEELDRLLPELLARLDRLGARATFFVLGEVADRLPARVREIAHAGHEVACHGQLHLRAGESAPAVFRRELAGAKGRLEDLLGTAVVGYRAPEWSLRTVANPRLRAVAELGFRYDSSLMPAAGAGRIGNPRSGAWLAWPDTPPLLELPPLVWGPGALAQPAGGWCGRCAPVAVVRQAVARARFALLVVHPWELIDRPVPGLFTGFARFCHDAGRIGYGERFDRLLAGLRPRPLAEIAAGAAVAGADWAAQATVAGEERALRPTPAGAT